MQASSQPLTQSASTAAPDRSAILAPPNLAPDDTDWISTASLTFKVLAGAGELDRTGIAKAIANIALPILELAQANKEARDEVKDTIKYLDEILRSASEEINLLQEGGSPTDGLIRPLVHLQQLGDEFVSRLEVLKADLNKIYGKTGFRAKIKRSFQSKAILDRINQHKVYVKETRDRLVEKAFLSMLRQVKEVDAKVTVIHNHLMSSSRIQPVDVMLSAIPSPTPSVLMDRDDLVQEGIANLVDPPHSITIMGSGHKYEQAKMVDDDQVNEVIIDALLDKMRPELPEDSMNISISNIVKQVTEVLSKSNTHNQLLSLSVKEAQCTLDFLQDLLDVLGLSIISKRIILKTIFKLTHIHDCIPQCLTLRGFKRMGDYPFAIGHYGELWRGEVEGIEVAVKQPRIFTSDTKIKKVLQQVRREAIIWRQCDHPNVLPFYSIYHDSASYTYCLVSPFMVNGSLLQYMDKTDNLDQHKLTLHMVWTTCIHYPLSMVTSKGIIY